MAQYVRRSGRASSRPEGFIPGPASSQPDANCFSRSSLSSARVLDGEFRAVANTPVGLPIGRGLSPVISDVDAARINQLQEDDRAAASPCLRGRDTRKSAENQRRDDRKKRGLSPAISDADAALIDQLQEDDRAAASQCLRERRKPAENQRGDCVGDMNQHACCDGEFAAPSPRKNMV